MNTYEARDMARNLLSTHGLSDQGWSFKFNTNATRVGVCRFRYKSIEVSSKFLAQMDEARLRNVLTHEIAHALVGPGRGHGPVWVRMHKSLGGDGQRCQQGITLTTDQYLYRIVCSVDKRILGHANRKGKRLARSVCTCHSQPPLWIAQR
jgi:predicted SprT family Zn-dependent metalloprotease